MSNLLKKLLLISILFINSLCFAQGMIGQISSAAVNSTTGATRYLGISAGGNATWSTTEATGQQVMPVDGTFSAFRVALSGTSGTGTRAFTFRKNGADTLLAASITNAQSNTDLINSFSVVSGDTVDMKQVTSGTLNSVTTYWNTIFTATNPNEYPLLYNSIGTAPAGATRWIGIQGDPTLSITEAARITVMPTDGTLSRMFVLLTTATLTNNFVVTVRINGVDTLLTTTIATNGTSNNNVSDVITIHAGDRVSVSITNNGTATPRLSMGLKWSPTINGEVIATNPMGGSQAQASTRFLAPMGNGGVSATESAAQQICAAATIKKMFNYTSTAIGGAVDTYDTTFRVNGVDSALTTRMNTGDTAQNDTTHTATCADGDLISTGGVTSALTGSVVVASSVVMLMTQPATPTPTITPSPTPAAKHKNVLLLGAG